MEEVAISKLVHGGQGLGELADGRKVFVWNALPGEKVRARLIKQKRSYAEAIAESVVEASPERVSPEEDNYLSTSPWQIMTFESENEHKKRIVEELFTHEKVALPGVAAVRHDDRQWEYRNKMEYSFWGDEAGIHLALHRRGSHGKQIVTGSKLAMPALDAGARAIAAQLSSMGTRAGDLKTVIVRCNQAGETVAALYTKLEKFTELTLPPQLKGLRVYHSNPKSPASVPTQLLYELGNCHLEDRLLGRPFHYNVDAFFQVNVPVFEQALDLIRAEVTAPAVTDMYAGVGAIGLSVAQEAVDLIEIDPASAQMAATNASLGRLEARVIEASSEQALEHLSSSRPVIFDPPRAGLHPKVVQRVLEQLPPQVVYLSCNPATQARDLALLQTSYAVTQFEVFNLFPRTPHIETLAVLQRY